MCAYLTTTKCTFFPQHTHTPCGVTGGSSPPSAEPCGCVRGHSRTISTFSTRRSVREDFLPSLVAHPSWWGLVSIPPRSGATPIMIGLIGVGHQRVECHQMVGFHLSTLKQAQKFPGCAQFMVYHTLEIQADGPTPKLSLGPSNSTNPRALRQLRHRLHHFHYQTRILSGILACRQPSQRALDAI